MVCLEPHLHTQHCFSWQPLRLNKNESSGGIRGNDIDYVVEAGSSVQHRACVRTVNPRVVVVK